MNMNEYKYKHEYKYNTNSMSDSASGTTVNVEVSTGTHISPFPIGAYTPKYSPSLPELVYCSTSTPRLGSLDPRYSGAPIRVAPSGTPNLGNSASSILSFLQRPFSET